MTLCTVTGTLTRPDGTALAFMQARFAPAPAASAVLGGRVLSGDDVVVTTDAAGDLSVALAPGTYSLTVDHGRYRILTALLSVPTAATADLEDLIVRLPGPPRALDAAASAALAAEAAGRAVVAAASALSGRGPFIEDFGGGTDRTPEVNTAAANACAAAGFQLHFNAGTYRFNGPILFAPNNESGTMQAAVVRGAGNAATVLLQENHAADVLVFVHEDPAAAYRIRPQVADLSIHYVGGTATGAAIRHRQTLGAEFRNITIDGPSWGIIGERVAQARHHGVYFRSNLRTSGSLADAAFLFDHDSVQNTGLSFGNFMSDCEVQSGQGTKAAILLRASDGLYVTNSHFDFCQRIVHIEPDGAGGRTEVLETMFSNCYFDQNPDVPLLSSIYIRAPGASPVANVANVSVIGGIIRGPATVARVFEFDRSAGGLSGIERLRVLKFIGVEMRGFASGFIDMRGPDGFTATARIWDVTVQGCTLNNGNNNRDTGPVRNYGLITAGRGVSVQGNTWRGNWSAVGERPILVSAESDGVSIHDEVFMTFRTRDDNVEVAAGATSVSLQGLGGQNGASVAREVFSSGGTGGDYWVRYTDGRQECSRRLTLTDIEVNIAWGPLFRSADLTTPETRVFPVPFLDGTIPTVTVQARVRDHNSLTLLSGTPFATEWPPQVRVAADISMLNRTVEIEMRAEGRWQ